jgi:N-acetylglutamate synthase-like GNAT family acetyltransferase
VQAPVFVPARLPQHRESVLALNLEYATWVVAGVKASLGVDVEALIGSTVADYVEAVLEKVCIQDPAKGVLYLIESDGQLAGMAGLRLIRAGVGEVKRVFIRPEFRGRKLGEHALRRILADASDRGWPTLFLETGPFMTSAHRIYEACGFVNRSPYPEAEVPLPLHDRWRFMERRS